MMRVIYNEQLKQLHDELVDMGRLCESAIDSAMKSLFGSDKSMAQRTQELEKEIDEKERAIETLCMKLILRQQPVAGDLRKVSSALKMISDMERIGDQAQDIADISRFLGGSVIICEVHLKDMAQAVTKMVNDSIDAYVNASTEMAENVILYDNIVDDLFVKIKSEIIQEVVKNSDKGEELFDIMMVTKYLERIGDHACNIAEWVIYSVTGSHKLEKDTDNSSK
jgi:phosphate transport system protein